MNTLDDFTGLRAAMVERQLVARGIHSPLVLAAMGAVQREDFVPANLREHAYADEALSIGMEQTISQPYIVAYMAEALGLKAGERLLEVGTGSGYAAAIYAEIVGEVFSIERHEVLANQAADRLPRSGYDNVHVRRGDGTWGWPEAAPFDAIAVAATGPRVPLVLARQLKVGGRLVMPIGLPVGWHRLVRVTRKGENEFTRERLIRVRFVPLVESRAHA